VVSIAIFAVFVHKLRGNKLSRMAVPFAGIFGQSISKNSGEELKEWIKIICCCVCCNWLENVRSWVLKYYFCYSLFHVRTERGIVCEWVTSIVTYPCHKLNALYVERPMWVHWQYQRTLGTWKVLLWYKHIEEPGKDYVECQWDTQVLVERVQCTGPNMAPTESNRREGYFLEGGRGG
jgi:hypothetical protein